MSSPKGTCDVVGCSLPRFYVGKTTFGICRKHHLDLPTVIRQALLWSAGDSPERTAAQAQLMDWFVSVESACTHRVLKKSSEPCEVCARAEKRRRR